VDAGCLRRVAIWFSSSRSTSACFLHAFDQHALRPRKRRLDLQVGIRRNDRGVGSKCRRVERAFEVAGAEVDLQRDAGGCGRRQLHAFKAHRARCRAPLVVA
jgi:hypothetical protein